MPRGVRTPRKVREQIAKMAILDANSRGSDDPREANGAAISRKLKIVDTRTVQNVMAEPDFSVFSQNLKKELIQDIDEHKNKLSKILEDKLSDEEEVKKMSVYQSVGAYNLLVTTEGNLIKLDNQVNIQNNNFTVTYEE